MLITAKNSIKATIFVTIYIFFIFLISLFKGINLYNIKIPYISVSHIFLKIDKKLILKAQNIRIFSYENYQKSTFNIHKEFYLLSKILPLFEEIKLKNITYNNKLLFEEISINKNFFHIYSKNLNAIGHFKIKYNYTSIYLDKLELYKYLFSNCQIFSYYTPKYIFANIKIYYNKKPFYITLKIKNSFIKYSILFNDFHTYYKNWFFNLKKCKGFGTFDINSLMYYTNISCPKINFNNKKEKISATSFKNKISLKNKNLYISGKNINIQYKNYNALLKNYHFIYEIISKNIILESQKLHLKYKNYFLNSKNLAFNINLKNKNFFLHTTDLLSNFKKTSLSSKEILVYKNNNILYLLNNNKIKNNYLFLANKFIKGNLQHILVSEILGKIFNFKTFISPIKINLKTKTAINKKITINNITFNDNIINFSKKPYSLRMHTNTLLNKKVREILKHFKINIPIIQTKGKNNIQFTFLTNLKNINFLYNILSLNSTYKIDNIKIPLKYQKLTILGNLNETNLTVKNLQFPYRFLNLNIDSNITINIPHKYLNAYVFIKKLDIDKYLQIKNFNEKIAINLINDYIFLLNSSIFINLKNKTIFFYDLKRILKYSIFHEIFSNGKAIIKILKNKLAIFINAEFNYPVILNQQNPKAIKANLTISQNNIKINAKDIKIEIKNLNTLKATVKNKDLDVIGMVKSIKTINKLINEINSTNTSNVNFTATVKGINTNFIYKNHKFITKKAFFEYNKEFKFYASYDKSTLKGFTKNGYLLIEGKNYTKKTLIPLLSFFKHFYSINLNFILIRSPLNFYTGKIYINSGIVKDLKALNNIVAFINTIPALLTLHTPGFSSKGYKIKQGFINYVFYKNILYFKKINIKGVNLNFEGKGYLNTTTNNINLKLNVTIKFKLKKLPIIGKSLSYLFFGKDGNLHIQILVTGNANDPKIKEDLGIGILNPFILFKRALTLPFNIF